MSCEKISDTVRVGFTSCLGGGGGGVACVTLTVTVRESEPPGPLAVRVYVDVLVGNTWRLPDEATVPICGLMLMSVVSPVTAHRSVADCPRSIVLGSAWNVLMFGLVGAAFGGSVLTGVGVGAVATFFLHPSTANNTD
jgi:hypothetical protein